MAYESAQVKIGTLKAAADLSSYQYHLVKVTADNTVNICAAVTDKPIGVLVNKPSAVGAACEIVAIGVTKVITTGAVTYGQTIGTDTSGHAVAKTPGTDTNSYGVGQVLFGATDAHATVAIDCLAAPRLSAS
jgi:hypothetical protein